MRAVQAFAEARGFDTIAVLNATDAQALRLAGRDFAMRYLETLTAAEVSALTAAGLGVMGVEYGPEPGWQPGAAAGAVQGAEAVARAKAAGLVDGTHTFTPGTYLWFDLEGLLNADGSTKVPPAAVIMHVNAWAAAVQGGGYGAGLYVGEGHLLTSAELYALRVDRYWRGASTLRDRNGDPVIPACGWCVFQELPADQQLGGVEVDRDVIWPDFRGRLPVWTA